MADIVNGKSKRQHVVGQTSAKNHFEPTVAPGIRRSKLTGKWFLNKYINGRVYTQKLDTTSKTIAVAKAHELIAQLCQKTADPVADTDPAEVSFDYAVTLYGRELERQAEMYKDQPSRMKTVGRLRDHLASLQHAWETCPKLRERGKADFLRVNPSKITPDDIQEFRTWMKSGVTRRIGHRWTSKKIGYSAFCCNKAIRLLGEFYKTMAQKNPLLGDPTRELKHLPMIKVKPVLPSDEQWEKMLRKMDELYKKPKSKWTRGGIDLIRAMAYLGTRVEETGFIKVKDVDLEGGWVVLPDEYVKGRLGHKQGRSIPILREARPFFEQLVARALQRNPDRQKSELFSVKTADALLRKLSKDVGMTKPMTHHTLRKFLNTLLAEKGVATAYRAEWLGQRDKGYLNETTYTGARPCHMQKLKDTLSVFTPDAAQPAPVASVEVVNALMSAIADPDQLRQLSAALANAAKSLEQTRQTEKLPANVEVLPAGAK